MCITGEQLGAVEGLAAALLRPLVAVAGKPRLEAEALERQGRPQQVAPEPLEAVVIIRSHGDRIVGRKAGVTRLPRVQQLDPLVGEQTPIGEKRDHLVAQEELGGASVYARYRMPRALPILAPS